VNPAVAKVFAAYSSAGMRAGILIALTAVAGVAVAADLNYDELIPLDAEALAETGLKPAYE